MSIDNSSTTSEAVGDSGKRQWPKPLGEDAFSGFAGEFIYAVQEHTEADPAALLFQFLVCFGNCVGTGAAYRQEWTLHHAREFVLIVGRSAKARKGTSWNIIREIFLRADKNWSKTRIVGGLGSGEGVVNCVRDPLTERDEKGRETTIAGADDRRLMVLGTLETFKPSRKIIRFVPPAPTFQLLGISRKRSLEKNGQQRHF